MRCILLVALLAGHGGTASAEGEPFAEQAVVAENLAVFFREQDE